MNRVCAVIPAAGGGTRVGGKPKQFRPLGDSPLICCTVRAFERHEGVHDIVVVVPKGAVEPTAGMLRDFNKLAAVVAGGATRQASVASGLQAVAAQTDIVLVHDAARPFIPPKEIAAVIEAAARYGAAALAAPIVDTVRYAEDGVFTCDIIRKNLFAVQTPQGFTREILLKAYIDCTDESAATDDVALVRNMGNVVHLVPGRTMNFKITTQEDWMRAELLWPAFEQRYYRVS